MKTAAQILKSKPEHQTVHTIEPTATVYEAVKLMADRNVGALVVVEMTRNRLRHLPVVDGGELVGLISIGDLVKATISEQQFIIEQLEHYIHGQRD